MLSAIIKKCKEWVRAAQRTEFSVVFGSAIQKKWFATLTQHAGNYLFSAALVMWVLRFVFTGYEYKAAKNKNLYENSNLLFRAVQAAIAVTAIIGKLAATILFVTVTPILMLCAVALDSLYNLTLLAWNFYKYAELYLLFKNKHKDGVTQLKYEYLKNIYTENIKKHVKSAVICLCVAAAVTFVFLLPHIGLPAVAGVAITLGAVKLTLSALSGITASSILFIPTIMPVAVNVLKKIDSVCEIVFNKCISFFMPKSLQKPTNYSAEVKKNVAGHKDVPKVAPKPRFEITEQKELKTAQEAKFTFNAYSYNSQYRDLLMTHITNKDLALSALKDMLEKKIASLECQSQNSLSWSDWWQQNKRQQKYNALTSIYEYLLRDPVYIDRATGKKTSSTMDVLLEYTERVYPDVDKSFFLSQSDTRNVIEACKIYNDKFLKPQREALLAVNDVTEKSAGCRK